MIRSQRLAFIALVTIGLIVGAPLSSCTNKPVGDIDAPKRQPFVIRFEDMASLDPSVVPTKGVVVDRKANTMTVEPGVDSVLLRYGGNGLKARSIGCELTFTINRPLSDSTPFDARISKGGDVLASSVSYEMVTM